jgi:hypothetical protein
MCCFHTPIFVLRITTPKNTFKLKKKIKEIRIRHKGIFHNSKTIFFWEIIWQILNSQPNEKHKRNGITRQYKKLYRNLLIEILRFYYTQRILCTIKTWVLFLHLYRHRNSASATVISTLYSVCLSVKTTLLSVNTTLPLCYRVLEMTLLVV